MEAMRVTGLMSGLDTNAIVDSYMAAAKAPIVKMNQEIDELTYEKSTFNNLMGMIKGVKDSMLDLKMESTFKSKVTTSTNEDIATAVAGINTPAGSYTLKVDQVAEPAFATSLYTNKVVSKLGAGVKTFTPSFSPYDQLEGTHSIEVMEKQTVNGYNNKWIAKDTFKGNANNVYSVNHADKVDFEINGQGIINGNGELIKDLKGKFSFVYNYNGEQKSFPVELDFKKGDSINKIAEQLDLEINAKLDALHANDSKQTMKVTINLDDKGFNFSFYDVDTQNEIEVLGFVDPNDKGDPNKPNYTPTAESKLLDELGLNATYKSQQTKEITNVIVSNSQKGLGDKLNDNGNKNGGYFINGKFEWENGTGPKPGKIEIYQDSSAICRPETYTTFYGDKIDGLDKHSKEELDKLLNTKIGSKTSAGNTLFPSSADLKGLNGVFYINGAKIEIEDYKKLTPNELMAKVNGSGANVTMTFNYETKSFEVRNNKGGAAELTMGNDTDTSKFFDLFKVGLNSGATYVRGQNTGSIDTTTVISKLQPPFTYPMKSGTFSINGTSIYVDVEKDSVQDVIDKVNKSGAGVTMTYDSTTDKFSLTSTKNERIKVGGPNDTSSFLLSTGIVYHQGTEQIIGTEGKEAIFTMNGTKYTRDTNEVKDVVPGMTFNISSTGTTVFNVKTDTDKAIKAVSEFAAKYNTLINALNPPEISYNDDLRKNYSEPLTEEKKATMSEDEIKKYQESYEKVAYHDIITKSPEVRSLKMNIRSQLTAEIYSDKSKYHSILDLGINIAGSATRDTKVTKLGLLLDVSTDPEELAKYLKEQTKFTSILSDDPEGVYNFFADSKTVYERDPITGKETSKLVNIGWGKTYSDFLDTTVNTTSALYKKTSTNGTIESEISSIKKQIDTQSRRVEMYLERLYAQFAAMENKVGALQQSASYLANIGNNNNSK